MNPRPESPPTAERVDAPRRCLFFYQLFGLKLLIFAGVFGFWWITRPSRRPAQPPSAPTPAAAISLREVPSDATLRAYSSDPRRVQAGEELYETACFECHGAGGHGIPGLGSDLVDGVWSHGGSPREIYTTIVTGARPAGGGVPMPALGHFGPEAISEVVAYLLAKESEARNNSRPTPVRP